uniref:cysteine dioxygenase n=1 Tax=Oryza sativa subsp. japonica TaxID=39947 RepID=Q10SM3_ORYSJ|nr:hypothetical protein LOC_Os03g02630 [Oryza sativa Japonica Group]
MELCAGIIGATLVFGRDPLNKRAGSSSPKILSGSGQSTRRLITDRIDLQPACYRQFYLCQIQIQICIKGIHGFKLISYAPGMDQSEHHHRLASTAADWCFRLHGWPIMPPLLGVYVFTDRLAFAAADWCFRLHGWPIMPPLLGVYVFTDRLAFAAADWCFRLHGWPLCRRCWASTSSPTGLPSPLPTGVSACTADLYAAVVGRLRLHRPAASSAADWCFRLHG